MKVDTGATGIGQVDQHKSQNTWQAFDSGAMVGVGDGCGESPDRQHKIQGEAMAEMMQRVCQSGTTGRG